ncbi:hypothetical protein ACHWQZ_G014175 [Mnemiopsis leidyi]
MSSSTRLGTRISTRVNKLAARKVADRDSIQQICDQPAARKLMSWLDTVLQDETLTEAEYEKYEEMCASQIDDLFAEEDVKLPRLRSEKSSLEAEVAALQQELLECQERERVFSKQYNILSERDQRIRETGGRCTSRLGDGDNLNTTAASKVLQHRFEKQLEGLDTVIRDHIRLHQQDQGAAKFLSSFPLGDYVEAELEFTKALGKYSEKLFFPGISRVPGNPRDCALVETDEEDKENSRRSVSNSYRRVRDTVRRVKSTYLERQEEKIAETVNSAANEAKVMCLKSLIGDLTNDKFPKDEETLNRMAEEYSIACIRKEDEVKLLWKTQCLPLMVQLKNLLDVSILCGNYKLKLARQNYFMSRQDKIIDNLLSQLSRQELLQIMLEHEHRTHKESIDMLQDMLGHVSLLNKTMSQQRALVHGEDAIRPLKADKLCLGGNDKTLNCVITMLRSYLKQDTHNIFHTYEDLAGAITRLVGEAEGAREDSATAANNVSNVAASLDDHLDGCAKCIDKGFTSTTMEEDRLAKSIEELEHLACSLKDSFTSKTEAIRNSDTVGIARKLFVWFFTDPSKLNEVLHGEF